MLERPVKTPCIGVCSTGIGDSCVPGLQAFLPRGDRLERLYPEQKSVVDQRLSGFLSQCVSNKLQVTDQALLQWQLQVQQIGYNEITTSTAGSSACSRRAPARSTNRRTMALRWIGVIGILPLTELREMIDQEF